MPSSHPAFANVKVYDHPLIQHKLTIMRDKRTRHEQFRQLLNQIAGLMAYEVSRNLPVRAVDVETPVAIARGTQLAAPTTIVPILRAGLAMMDGFLALFPEAHVAHIGIYRDEKTAKPVTYYAKMPPDIARGPAIVVDPMLATGGSAVHAVDLLKNAGCTDIQMVVLVAAPEGINALRKAHPDLRIHAAAIDERLNERFYIVPGLGDAGDRIFGTA
ncbi:MAG: uracil phosphoribosyltransferase [Planctomycetaceae bacterium]|jgi:uracil phosphoribosyltransferase|nr:uracil phosphoribosyltransferase [Planctomycetaceae bacterium]